MPAFRTRARETEQAVGPLTLALAVGNLKFDSSTPNTHPIVAGQRVSDTRPLVGVRASSRTAITSVEAEASDATKEKAPTRAAAAKVGEKTAAAKAAEKAAATKAAATKAAHAAQAANAAKAAEKKLKATEARAVVEQAAALKTASKDAQLKLTAVGKEANAAKKQTRVAEKAAEKAKQDSNE